MFTETFKISPFTIITLVANGPSQTRSRTQRNSQTEKEWPTALYPLWYGIEIDIDIDIDIV